VRADYAENGDLALAVNLQGTNPDVEKGRAIVYNLTINENVLVLLESLRAQNAIIDRVERGILKK
ncbi:MAG: YdbH domain-containing protein, partial [Pseudomonadales bacterium]